MNAIKNRQRSSSEKLFIISFHTLAASGRVFIHPSSRRRRATTILTGGFNIPDLFKVLRFKSVGDFFSVPKFTYSVDTFICQGRERGEEWTAADEGPCQVMVVWQRDVSFPSLPKSRKGVHNNKMMFSFWTVVCSTKFIPLSSFFHLLCPPTRLIIPELLFYKTGSAAAAVANLTHLAACCPWLDRVSRWHPPSRRALLLSTGEVV